MYVYAYCCCNPPICTYIYCTSYNFDFYSSLNVNMYSFIYIYNRHLISNNVQFAHNSL